MSESSQQKAIIQWLKLKGAYVLRLNSGSLTKQYKGGFHHIQLCPRGTPDLYVLLNGYSCFIEVKKDEKEIKAWQTQFKNFQKTARITPYNQRSVHQHKQQNKIRDAGGFTLVACSVKMVEEDLKALSILTH